MIRATLRQRLLGGRPMDYVDYAFMDSVAHKPVFYWRDCYGRCWMAYTRWGWFRVRRRAMEAGQS